MLIAQGDHGDCYYAIGSGEVEVGRDGLSVQRLQRGAGVGEMALLTDAPRAATVTSLCPTVVWEVDREPFLLAVTGHEPSRDAAWRHIRSFESRPDRP